MPSTNYDSDYCHRMASLSHSDFRFDLIFVQMFTCFLINSKILFSAECHVLQFYLDGCPNKGLASIDHLVYWWFLLWVKILQWCNHFSKVVGELQLEYWCVEIWYQNPRYTSDNLRIDWNTHRMKWDEMSLDDTWTKSRLCPASTEVDYNVSRQALEATRL